MTQEEKQLLLKDLCARLPYEVKVKYLYWDENKGCEYPVPMILDDINSDGYIRFHGDIEEGEGRGYILTYLPYLRPLSSMTEDEENELTGIAVLGGYNSSVFNSFVVVDWLNAHHFDYRGLIEKGLAFEAPEGIIKKNPKKGSEIPIPKTVNEAVKTLAKIVSKEDRDYLLENGAISMHNSMGRWIRNEWGLWTDSELKNELKKKGFEHPDDMSNYIIEEFIKYWNNKI